MRKISIMVAIVLAMALCASSSFADKLQEVKARGVLICGVKDAVVPFGYIDANSKHLVGMDIDVCNYIAKQLGVKTEFKPVTSATRIPMLVQGSIDLAAATMTHKIARDDTIDFSITYFMDGQKLLVKKGSGIKSVADLKGQKVGTAKGSTSEQNILRAQPAAKVLSFEGYPQAFLALKQGKVKAVTTDSTILLGLKNSDPNPAGWEIVGDFISPEPYGLGLPENESNFRDAVNVALIEMWKSGDYQKIYNKWFGPDTKYALPLTWQMELWP
ncbi:ABC transporter substrate-binding protein [Desulfovibrio sp. UCD-KL4C]|uniref:ABC transporter substrate-binding protein n=1 Tax=Desulfovibrio sp. UCD-KL4C TaxID=2578120 RepID=UPI0025BC3335|nr:ABC transporter substrate-binding protein [Desulfovibrio sp. UCD-KL4C]